MIRRFITCRAGSVAISTIVVMTLLIGLTGLGVEVSRWYQTKRLMQGAADAAAVSASWAMGTTDDGCGTTNTGSCTSGSSCSWAPGLQGLAVASENGWQHSATNGIQVKVASPPTLKSSPYYNNPDAVEVSITQPQSSLFGVVAKVPETLVGAYSISVATTACIDMKKACVLALANASNAIVIHGKAGITASCGIEVDGGIDQSNPKSSACASDGPPCGDVTLNGANAFLKVYSLTVTTPSLADVNADCAGRCTDINNPTSALTRIYPHTASPDPYSSRSFTRPGSVVTTVTIANGGSGYSPGTHTFTLSGGSGAPAKFTATVSKSGVVTAISSITDPGSYTTLPSGSVSATPDSGGGTGAKFTLTTGSCYDALPSPPVPGRAYCAINISNGTANYFPAGIYYVEGGDSGCAGFCVQGNNTIVCSQDFYNIDSNYPNTCCDPKNQPPGKTCTPTIPFNGVTFVLTKTPSGTTYANINATSGTLELTSPVLGYPINADGSSCAGSCANTTDQLLFFQDKNAPVTPDPYSASSCGTTTGTGNCFNGNGNRILSGSLYLHNQTVSFQGNSSIGGTCFGVVSKYVDVGGNPTFSNGCLPGGGQGSSTSVTKAILSE